MNYKKNPDNTFTAFQFMKDTNTRLEISASDLDEAKTLLKKEIADYRLGYGLVKTKRTYSSPGMEDGVGYIYARHSLADVIDSEVEKEEALNKGTEK